MEEIDDRSIQEKVLQSIRDAILDGSLPAGSPLRINTLATRLKVSHMPVRESLHVLTVEGLAVRQPRRGVVVGGLSHEDVVSAYDTMSVIEGLGARKAAEFLTEDDFTALRALLRRSEEYAKNGDFPGILHINHDFHERIYRAAPNRWRSEFYRQLSNFIFRVRCRYPQTQKRIQETLVEHRALVDALEARNGELAERIIKDHCLRSGADLLKQLPTPDSPVHPVAKRNKRSPQRRHTPPS